MAVNRQNNLYYEGYDPNWIIGSGNPPPLRTMQMKGPHRPVAATPPYAPVQANGFVPAVQVPHAEVYEPGFGRSKLEPQDQFPGRGPVHVHPAQFHAQKASAGIVRPAVQPHLSGRGKAKVAFQGERGFGMNPNPYIQPGHVVHGPVPTVHPTKAPVKVVPAPRSVFNVPVVHTKEPAIAPVSTPSVQAVTPAPIFKVVMWVPLCCEACEKKFKDDVTELPGFQGYDVERHLERVTVFGQVNPSTVLATVRNVIPRTQMWRH